MSCFIDLIWLVGFSESSKVWFHDWGPCGISPQPFDFMQWCQCPHRPWTHRPTHHPPLATCNLSWLKQSDGRYFWVIWVVSAIPMKNIIAPKPNIVVEKWCFGWFLSFGIITCLRRFMLNFNTSTIHVAWKLNISIRRGKHPFRGTSFFQATLSSCKRRLVTGIYTLLETNKRTIPFGTVEKMIFLFPKVGYGFVPWRVQFMWHVRPGEAFNTHFF